MKIYNCNICPVEFKTEKGLLNHKCRWFCKICGKKLTTLKGFNRHTDNHKNIDKLKKERQEKQLELQKQKEIEFEIKYKKLIELGLFNPLYKTDDKVIVSTYIVTKPTHKMGYNRMVRVRYEEERLYCVMDFIIDKVIEPTVENLFRINNCIKLKQEYPIQYLTKNLKVINESDIFEDRDKAIQDSIEKQKKYKESCDFASFCR